MASFRFDGKPVSFEPGDTLGTALHRQGILEIARSMKYHRARGIYCGQGSCGSCLVDVDGVPNTTACTAPATEGAVVQSQNRIGSAKRDLLAVTDKVYRRGFDPHGAFTKPRLLNRAFMIAVRFMSGQGKAPKSGTPAQAKRFEHEVDELIVGAGAAGMARAGAAKGNVLLIDEGPIDAAPVNAWSHALAFGFYGDVVAVRKDGDLHEIKAKQVTLATGQHDAWPLFANNDLPGIMSRSAATRFLAAGVLPGARVVLHPDHDDEFAETLAAAGAVVVGAGNVTAAHGRTRVKAATVDGKKIACHAIVCNLPGAPRIELAQQAGCQLTVRNGALTVAATNGQTTRSDVRWEGP